MERIIDAIQAFPAVLSADGTDISDGFTLEDLDLSKLNYHSPSRAKKLFESGKHFEWSYIKGFADPETPAKQLGSLLHWALLRPEQFKKRYVIQPEFSGKGMKAAKAEWQKTLRKDALVLNVSQAQLITDMINSLYSHPEASKLLSNGTSEVNTFYKDPEFKDHLGNPIQWFTILDFIRSGNVLVEVKTTRCAEKMEFERDAWKFGYHMQTFIGRRCLEGVVSQRPMVMVIAIENKPPHCVSVFAPDGLWMDQGFADVRDGIYRMNEGYKTGIWHGYYEKPQPIGLPAFAYDEPEEDEI